VFIFAHGANFSSGHDVKVMAAISGLDAILQWALMLPDGNSAPGLIAVSLLLVAILSVPLVKRTPRLYDMLGWVVGDNVGGLPELSNGYGTAQPQAIPLAWCWDVKRAGTVFYNNGRIEQRLQQLNNWTT